MPRNTFAVTPPARPPADGNGDSGSGPRDRGLHRLRWAGLRAECQRDRCRM